MFYGCFLAHRTNLNGIKRLKANKPAPISFARGVDNTLLCFFLPFAKRQEHFQATSIYVNTNNDNQGHNQWTLSAFRRLEVTCYVILAAHYHFGASVAVTSQIFIITVMVWIIFALIALQPQTKQESQLT